ncbi:unnamed protein product [Timema podura]|uniref:Uncharacterized protein n=1 Tax=Timema podura TaxID=61482 RepID=A0ABN7NXP8_TIMPD|nr:unnamed protein product [Timema podura]
MFIEGWGAPEKRPAATSMTCMSGGLLWQLDEPTQAPGQLAISFQSRAVVKMEHFQAALDPRKQELLEARFLGARVSEVTIA